MQSKEEQLAHLQEIRTMMERSSRFISLSGLSGVGAGVAALLGAGIAYAYLQTAPGRGFAGEILLREGYANWGMDYQYFFPLLAGIVLVLALASGIFFTSRKARREGMPIWDALTRRLLVALFLPLITGGIFCLALAYHGLIGLVAPATLVFYGLALLNASKYTLSDIRYLGLSEIALGLIGSFLIGYGLDLWALGFGLLHIVYGLAMYRKYA